MRKIVSRRSVIVGAGAAFWALPAKAAKWPERTITLVHGFGVGGNADVISRIVAESLSRRLGQPVIVEARTGAGGRIAANLVSKAAPDGYTIAVLPGGHAIAPAMYEGLPYDTVNDFTYVSMLTEFPFLLVTYGDHPVRSIPDLLKAARDPAKPLIYGSAGNGTGQHLSGALFARMANLNMQHLPFRGGALGSTELLGKHIDFLFETPTLLLELVKSGQLRALGVTGRNRFFALPDVPTIGESIPGYETSSWLGLAAPPKLPEDLVALLNSEVRAILADAAVVDRIRSLGNIPTPTSPADFKARVAADVKKWTQTGAEVGLTRGPTSQ